MMVYVKAQPSGDQMERMWEYSKDVKMVDLMAD